MEQKVIKELSNAELYERLAEEKSQLVKLKLNHAVSPLENTNKLRIYKKAVARFETEIRKRIIEEQTKK